MGKGKRMSDADIAALEHLNDDDAEQAVADACELGDDKPHGPGERVTILR